MTDPLGEKGRNSAKKQEKNVLKPFQIQNIKNKHNTLVLYNRWKKHNEIQLTKNKMDLNNRK